MASRKRMSTRQGVSWFRVIGLFKHKWEWLVATSCKRGPPLVGWQRAPGDVIANVLLIHARKRHWPYWLRDLAELMRKSSHTVVAGGSAT